MLEDYLRDISLKYRLSFFQHSYDSEFLESYKYVSKYPYKLYCFKDNQYNGLEISEDFKICQFSFSVSGSQIDVKDFEFESLSKMTDFIEKWCISQKC